MHTTSRATHLDEAWNTPVRHAFLAFIVLSALVVAAPGHAQSAPPGRQSPAAPEGARQPAYETAQLTLPAGDRTAGRQAFQDLKCPVCHAVTGEAAFPAPVADAPAPPLDSRLSARPASEVANAIVAPSHSISLRVSPELKKRLSGSTLSPMGDFSRAMTVRQLSDLLAYLRSITAGG